MYKQIHSFLSNHQIDGINEENFESEVWAEEDADEEDKKSEDGSTDVKGSFKGSINSWSPDTFKNVESNILLLSVKDDCLVRKWIDDFEDNTDLTSWEELQKKTAQKNCWKTLQNFSYSQ